MKEYFNNDLIMSEKEEHLFKKRNSCRICKKLINNDEKKGRDHCHITGRFRVAAHQNCNANLK